MQSIPYHYYPLTITLVDDDSDLLDSLKLALMDKHRCQSFTSPSEALSFLAANQKKYENDEKQNLGISFDAPLSIAVNVEIANIYKKIYDKDRFKRGGIVVVDYNMPEINGLELSKKLKALDFPIKIIMLTGVADQQTAINAFNNKQIDRFLVKSALDYNEKLLEYIEELQLDFFIENTHEISNSIKVLHDPEFVKFFHQFVKENKIVEYYLYDESGSFLMLDENARTQLLILRNLDDMEMYHDFAENEGNVPQQELNALKNKERVVLFAEREGLIPPYKDWISCPANKLTDEIYYGILTSLDTRVLDLANITSYLNFLEHED